MGSAALRHGIMAVGGISTLFAVLAIFDQSWELVYAWLGLGLVVEASLYAIWSSKAVPDAEPPSGERFVLAVHSFLNTVFVPVIAMLHAGFLDGTPGILVAVLIVLAGQYRLAFHTWAEPVSEFHGLPACWGVAGFYLQAFDATPLAADVSLALLVVVGLLPMVWPHPLKSPMWKGLTRVVTGVWILAAVSTTWRGFPAVWHGKTVFLLAVAYGLFLAVVMTRAGAEAANAGVRDGDAAAAVPSTAFVSAAEDDEPDRTSRPL